MPAHREKRIVPYTPEQMFSLVGDVKAYPDFLPWVSAARLYNHTEHGFEADLSIGTSFMKQAYSSKVEMLPAPFRINVTHTKGPFHHLTNYWVFHEVVGGTEIDFFIDFEVSNPLLKSVLQPFLSQAVGMMVNAFEVRAKQLFS